jgi:hypothetical protein
MSLLCRNGTKDVNPDCILCETETQTTDVVRRGSIIAIQGKMKKVMMMMMMMMRAYSWLFRSCKRIFFYFFFTNSKAKSKATQVSPSASPSPPYGDEGHGFG